MIILLHTSKTMRAAPSSPIPHEIPQLFDKARVLSQYLKSLSQAQLARHMKLSPALAAKTFRTIADFSFESSKQRPAIDCFIGDIYSGLQAHTWSNQDRLFAQSRLAILSGLYGVLRPLDGIHPYRLEMGYKFPDAPFTNLYQFWDDTIARTLPAQGKIINLSSVEYSKTVTPYVDKQRFITPQFLTVDTRTNEPTFVTVHTKIARGAMARWLIVNRTESTEQLQHFDDLGYRFDAKRSQPDMPTFVCQEFGGIGLSVRLQQR